MYCFDANIWVYYFDTDLPEHSAVVDHVRDALRTQPLFTTTVLQMEVVHYLHTQHADASSAIDRFSHNNHYQTPPAHSSPSSSISSAGS